MNGGVINGAVLQYTPAGLSVVAAPPGATDLGWFNVNGVVPLAAGDYKANGINVNVGGSLVVTGGQARIWTSGWVNINAQANAAGVPKNLQILITGATGANINSGGRFSGVLYAPLAQVYVNDTVFGSVVGSTVTLNSGGKVHYDEDSACVTCPPEQVICGGVCTSTQSDANNCGACGNVCSMGWACELGTCIPPSSCMTGNAPAAVTSGTDVFVYEPLGSWSELTNDIKRFQVEPVGSPAALIIPTHEPVNACSANSVTKAIFCSENDNWVDGIAASGGVPGTELTGSWFSDASGTQTFSGGTVTTANLAVDSVNNRAVIAVGVAPGNAGGFQMFDLATSTMSPVVPAGPGIQTSEALLIDPVRNLVLSPNEQNHYILFSPSTSSVFDMPITLPLPGMMDSAAEDCSTGIALASVENTGQLVLVNLNGATFSTGTWTAPYAVPNFPEFAPTTLSHGTTGLAVDSRSHLGIVTGEFGGSGFGVIRLPSTPPSASAAPAVLDYVVAQVPLQPNGLDWVTGLDPHATTVYTSPSSGRVFGVIANQSRTYVAVIDLQATIDAPRSAAHTATTPLPAGAVRFVQ